MILGARAHLHIIFQIDVFVRNPLSPKGGFGIFDPLHVAKDLCVSLPLAFHAGQTYELVSLMRKD